MNHRPFEDWLFSDEPLTPDETSALGEHLQSCESCRMLATSWQEVSSRLQDAPLVAPAQGFLSRWQARLEAEQGRLYRRQSLAMLGFAVGGAALLFASLILLAWPALQSPSVLFWTGVYRLAGVIAYAETAQDIFSILFQTATGNISLIWWVIFVGLLSELSVLWVVSLRLLTNPRRVTK